MKIMAMRIVVMAVLALALGCSEEKKADPTPPPTEKGAKPEAKAEPPAKGLGNKGNDPAVVALAKAAQACKPDGSRLEWNCDGFKAWRDSKLFEDDKTDATLLNLLEDSDEKVRFLGADRLAKHAVEDAAAAKRVLAAAQAETSPLVADALGKALGQIDGTKTGIAAEVNKLVSSHKLPELRVGLITTGASNPAVFDAILAVANESTDEKMRLAAEISFYNNTPSGKEADVCKMWLANVDHANAEVAGEAAAVCGRVSSCKANWEALLNKIEAKTKKGAVNNQQLAAALSWMHDGSESTAKQKARTLKLAKAIASNPKNDAFARSRTLEFLGPLDKAFVKKFAKDKEPMVKAAAERALQQK